MENKLKIQTLEDAKRLVEERQLSHIKVGIFDIDGVLRGKYMNRKKFFSALEEGFSFCNAILGLDVQDSPYDNTRYTGWHTGYPDAAVRIIPSSCREIFFEDKQLFFLAEFTGEAEAICPRALLRRVLQKANSMDFDVFTSFEYEFFVFNETPNSVREKGFRNLQLMTPDKNSYSIIRNTVHAEFYHQILAMGEQMDFPIESLHTETGPGLIEAALAVDSAEAAGDKAALFKIFMKILAQRNNKMATFMAKWSCDCSGQSGHTHISLKYKNSNKSAFYEAGQPYNMSTIQRQFIAGQQRLMPELLAMLSPTVNSYARLIPNSFAPTEATWGIENRTTALRIIPGTNESQRIEYRLGAADANPYLVLAAAIGSGLYGIEHQLEPTEAVRGNSYEQNNPELALPQTLWDAAQNLKKSTAAKALFGSEFVNHFVASREWEEREFRKHITDWELARYFEII